jgi:hypothetical protein
MTANGMAVSTAAVGPPQSVAMPGKATVEDGAGYP